MKICLVLQRRFAFVAHDIAIWLKKKYGLNNFCGWVHLRSSYEFLERQKDINYSSLVLDEDIHKKYRNEPLDIDYLKSLEKELGMPNLWPYIALDRVLMFNQPMREYPHNTPHYTHEEMMRVFQVKARAVIDFLDNEKPDAIVFPNIGGISSMLLYRLAQKRGIKILYITTASTEKEHVISETYDAFTGAEEIFRKNLQNRQKSRFYDEAKIFLENFRKKPVSYDVEADPTKQPVGRLKQLRFISPKNLFYSFYWFLYLIYEHFSKPYRHDYSYIHPWGYLKDRVRRKTRNLIGVGDLYDEFNPGEDFAFFPLHHEPEISLLLLSPFYTDQTYVIKQVARSLPVHFKLYVKEHPFMVPFRPRKYYKELKKIPNVRLINPKVSGLDIIQKAKLITTITGSTAWEGLMLKKPAISFGGQFYNCLSMVKRCHEIEHLPYLVKEQLENFKYDEEELLTFIAAILEDAAGVDLTHLWEQETNEAKKEKELEPLADLVAKKLGLNHVS